MKKLLLNVMFICAVILPMSAQIKYVQGSFKPYQSIDETLTGTDMGSQVMTASMIDFPMDWNGNDYCALVRVKIDFMSNEEIQKMTCNAEGGKHVSKKDFKNVLGKEEMWIFVEKGNQIDLTFSHPKYGQERVSNLKLSPKGMYQLTLQNSKRITLNFTTVPDGIAVSLDGENIGVTPCSKADIAYGKHFVEYYNQATGKKESEEINVDDYHTLFDKNMQQKREMKFTSKGKDGARLYIDGKSCGEMPQTLPVTYGTHTFVGRYEGYNDTIFYEVNDLSKPTVNFEIIKSKYIEFFATYNNSKTYADVYIDGEKQEGTTPMKLKIPYGHHKVEMYNNGNRKSKNLKVDENTATDFNLNIPPRNVRWNPFDIEYRKREFGLSAGYVMKSWKQTSGSKSTKYNFWHEGDEYMSGFQIGFAYQPLFGYGFGMNTGAYLEMYFSNSDGVIDYDEVQDIEIYVPVHFLYRLPISEQFSIFANGGIGMDFGTSIVYKYKNSTEEYKGEYGKDGNPNFFNLAAEFGGGFQYKALQVSATYSIGLLDNDGMFVDGNNDPISLRPMKLWGSIAVMF